MNNMTGNRRSFLKTGALVAAPFAVVAPAAAMATADNAARLARLEDERAVERIARQFLRRFNSYGAESCGEFLAKSDAIRIDANICAINEDTERDSQMEFSDNGNQVLFGCSAKVEFRTDFNGQSTMEKMARFQGHTSISATERRELRAGLAHRDGGWIITHLTLA